LERIRDPTQTPTGRAVHDFRQPVRDGNTRPEESFNSILSRLFRREFIKGVGDRAGCNRITLLLWCWGAVGLDMVE